MAADWVRSFAAAHVPRYTSFPMHGCFYYTSAERLREAFNADPGSALVAALADPVQYLGETGDGDNVSEDLCVAYRVYAEAGRLINLYDWFVAFGEAARDPDANAASRVKTTAKGRKKTARKKAAPKKGKRKGKARAAANATEEVGEEADEERGDAPVDPAAERLLLARFTRAVKELEYLGFVKETKRKTDHVIKLVFAEPQ